MKIELLIIGIGVAIWVLRKVFWSEPRQQSRRTYSNRPSPSHGTYRPRQRRGRAGIIFERGSQPGTTPPSAEALAGLHDAFTGAPLNPAIGLSQCGNCKVYYHTESVSVLREENSGQCVACGVAAIVSLTDSQLAVSSGRDYSPDLVTLSNFRSHFGRVITFEGRVQAVKVSRRGSDYAVMFENTRWVSGLKLVFFRGSIRKAGGREFIMSLQNKNVRVRGLLIQHARFGPEIVITERNMILGVN